ncbi:hypothetical protein [Methanospirillum lacunae]|uniref:hypothetical protein n=1 Tax=Methanospirillum lacunae TaxID=668570 RepID=UPI0015E85EFC|nr:hypothetical protein [Methanospirillum lacunae]
MLVTVTVPSVTTPEPEPSLAGEVEDKLLLIEKRRVGVVGVSDESSELSDRLVLFVSERPSDPEEPPVDSVVFDASESEAKAAVRVVSSSAEPAEPESSEPVVLGADVVAFDEDEPEEEADSVELGAESDEDVSGGEDVSDV